MSVALITAIVDKSVGKQNIEVLVQMFLSYIPDTRHLPRALSCHLLGLQCQKQQPVQLEEKAEEYIVSIVCSSPQSTLVKTENCTCSFVFKTDLKN